MRFCLLLGLLHWAAADIYSCGGFVKSAVPINYKNVKVKLLSPEGHLKSEEDCNAQNGYYMIPVYNKGQYTLKVAAPEGWHFEKDSIAINIDGQNDPCSKNEDINFVVDGFSITGVLDNGMGKGQAGIHLVLRQNGQIVDKTVTGDSGKYSFKAKPGKYEVSTSDSTDACVGRKAVSVEVVDKPVVVEPSLTISGYSLSIQVKNKGKGISGVPVTVFSTHNKLQNCIGLDSPVAGATFSCAMGKTQPDGALHIPCVPFGKYQARAEWSHEGTQFQFAPDSAGFEIVAGKKAIDFSVAGFSVRGRVTSSMGQGLEGVTVKSSHGQTVTTDREGYYQLSALQEGQLELKATAAHTTFTTVSTTIQLPNVHIPPISVDSYEVCGNVEKSSSGYERLVLSRKGSTDSVSVQPSDDGSFCKSVKADAYVISPADSSSSLTPRSLEVDLSKGPVLGLRFTHFKTEAEARVTCIGNCGQITLVLSIGNTVIQRKEGADVTFTDIGPGEYNVKLEDNDRGCWESKELVLAVDRSRPQAIHFVQNGFVTNVKLSHKAHLTWSHTDKKQIRGELNAQPGVNSICVPVQGQYAIAIQSCYTFTPNSLEVSVPTESISEAVATDARISGTVKGGDNGLTIKVKSPAGERELPVSQGAFTFQESLKSPGNIVLVPSSSVYLFEPQSLQVAFNGDCIEKAAHFDAEKGIFVDGRIQPTVKDVKITAVNNRDKNVELKAVSDASGRYRLGPVRRAEDLTISASLDGYSLTPRAGEIGVIDSVKLSKLTVVLVDSVSKERLEDVLLSVVGGSNYRSNSKVESNGEINFVGLAPGEYFVRPILQEYKFEPSTHTIVIKEGEHEHLSLAGKRVSYSVFGKVREMSKAPVQGVAVEALSEQCEQHQSEAVTGADGQFRIRGLRPDCRYRVSTKQTADHPSAHCFPSSFSVNMPASDVKGLEMVTAPQDRATMVAVEIDFGLVTLPTSYKLSLTRAGTVVSQTILHSPVTVFHHEVERNGAEYSVRVEPDKPNDAFKAKTVLFTADSPVRVVRVPITSSSSKSSEVEISLGSFLALPFFGILALIFLNQNKALEMLQSLYAQYKNGSASTPPPERKQKRRL